MFFLPDKVPAFHVHLPDNRPVKEKMMKHLKSKFARYLLGKVIMTETFGFLPDKRPVNFGYIFDV
jgi:hypothetical protein